MKDKVITPQIEWIHWGLLTMLFYFVFLPDMSLAEITTTQNRDGSVKTGTNYLAAPQNLKVSAGDGQVTLTWDRVNNADSYTVYQAKGSTLIPKLYQDAIRLNNQSSLLHLNGLNNGTRYYFIVTANKGSQESPASIPVFAQPQITVLAAPQNLKANAGDGQITLTWDRVNNADSYTVYQAQDAALTPKSYALYQGGTMLANQSSPLRLNGLNNGLHYYFIVTANKGSQESFASSTVSAQPQTTIVGTATGKLNDTGITRCANGSSNDVDCPVAGYPNQDAENGTNRMSFTKLEGGKCVKDNTTGLIWEVKQNKNNQHSDSLHDADDTYNWYNPDNSRNGGYAGYQDNNGNICYGYQRGNASTYCNTDAYVQRVNTQGWCGYSDWRLPSRQELRSIVNYGNYRLAIDSDYFPNTQSLWYLWYWSSSSFANNGNGAWLVLPYGQDSWANKSKSGYVRLVRSVQ